MSKTALITGITGFTGRYLKKELKASGYDVFGTTLSSEPKNDKVVKLNLCDFDSTNSVVNEIAPDIVAHLAGISFAAHENAQEIYQVNMLGTRNLLHALSAMNHEPKSILIASSANVYGNTKDVLCRESTLPNPINDYSVSKIAMEYMTSLWFDKLPVFIVRPFNYVGIGQSPEFLIPKMVTHFREKAEKIELGNTEVWRDFLDVRTIASIYKDLLEACPVGQTINVCSGEAISIADILNLLSEISGHKIQVCKNPAFVRKNEIIRLCGSNKLLKAIIGEIQPISFRDTLAWMYHTERT